MNALVWEDCISNYIVVVELTRRTPFDLITVTALSQFLLSAPTFAFKSPVFRHLGYVVVVAHTGLIPGTFVLLLSFISWSIVNNSSPKWR